MPLLHCPVESWGSPCVLEKPSRRLLNVLCCKTGVLSHSPRSGVEQLCLLSMTDVLAQTLSSEAPGFNLVPSYLVEKVIKTAGRRSSGRDSDSVRYTESIIYPKSY